MLLRSWSISLFVCVLLASSYTLAEDEDEDVLVTCGSLIKLVHGHTKFLLHSHEVSYQYGTGSGQQSVTGYGHGDDFGSYWMVASPKGQTCKQGTPIKSGTYIRLQHQATRRWLHSHLFKSPLTHNQEVSAFGDDDNSDTGDVWQLEVEEGGQWTRDEAIRLRHKDTGNYLVTHKYG